MPHDAAERTMPVSTHPATPAVLLRRAMVCAPPLALLTGCATRQATPIPRGTAVALVYASAASDKTTSIDNLALGSGAKTGAGGGALEGALSGFSCGPFAFLCVPAGLVVGGVIGWAGGAAVGVTGMLSPDSARAIRERLSLALRTHDLLAGLRDNITPRASKIWTLTAPSPTHTLRVHLDSVALTSTRSEFIGLVVRVHTTLTRETGSAPETLGTRDFEFAPTASPLSVWMNEDPDFIDTLFRTCSEQLASQIVAEYGRD
jgi:hypothetical protein